ncbi:DUF1439 domain-containing protein [Rhodoferax sp.]|uniref:DUF1439 domain-containing protein n=1 Tax=Rhodoferax sp. TaxID=50421 RepID=UPI00374D478E
MQRRFFLTASGGLLAGGLAGAAWAQTQPSYSVSMAQLQQTVAQRFPLRYPVAGLVDLNLQTPRLRLLPEQNRLGAEMAIEAAGASLRRSYSGSFDVDFALRYEASDRTLRATGLHFQHLQFPDLQPAALELLNSLGPMLAEQSLREVVLHRLRPQDLALPEGMGLQPGSITVTDKGLLIAFVTKPL